MPSPPEFQPPRNHPPSRPDTSSPPWCSCAANTPCNRPTHPLAPSAATLPLTELRPPASHSPPQTCSQTTNEYGAQSCTHSDSDPSIRCTESLYAVASTHRLRSDPATPRRTQSPTPPASYPGSQPPVCDTP